MDKVTWPPKITVEEEDTEAKIKALQRLITSERQVYEEKIRIQNIQKQEREQIALDLRNADYAKKAEETLQRAEISKKLHELNHNDNQHDIA